MGLFRGPLDPLVGWWLWSWLVVGCVSRRALSRCSTRFTRGILTGMARCMAGGLLAGCLKPAAWRL